MTKSKSTALAPPEPVEASTPAPQAGNGVTLGAYAEALQQAGQGALQWLRERRGEYPTIPTYLALNGEVVPGHPPGPLSKVEFSARLCEALGTTLKHVGENVVTQLLNGPGPLGAPTTTDDRVHNLNSGLAFIASNNPANEIETLVLLQIWQTQQASSAQLRMMARAERLPMLEAHGAIAVKLGNLQIRQLETLIKLRSAGKQVIEVQHVHVYPGGNAVVGTVNAGGASPGIERQPYELAPAYLAEVPCQETAQR